MPTRQIYSRSIKLIEPVKLTATTKPANNQISGLEKTAVSIFTLHPPLSNLIIAPAGWSGFKGFGLAVDKHRLICAALAFSDTAIYLKSQIWNEGLIGLCWLCFKWFGRCSDTIYRLVAAKAWP
jgi:hypothetical protein